VTQKPLNSYFHSLNRGKRAVCLDLKNEDGRRVFHKLVEEADVFVSNLRRPALARLQGSHRDPLVEEEGPGPTGDPADRPAGRAVPWTPLGHTAATMA